MKTASSWWWGGRQRQNHAVPYAGRAPAARSGRSGLSGQPSFGPREILQSLIADWGLQPRPRVSPGADHPGGSVAAPRPGAARGGAHRRGAGHAARIVGGDQLLSNLETAQHKLLQIVLFGQPARLDTLLACPSCARCATGWCTALSCNPERPRCCGHIEHRLRRAGWRGGALFEPRALRELTEASGGRIRAIHLLADKALLAAFAQGARQVERAHVRMAVAEVQGGGAAGRKAPAPLCPGAVPCSGWPWRVQAWGPGWPWVMAWASVPRCRRGSAAVPQAVQSAPAPVVPQSPASRGGARGRAGASCRRRTGGSRWGGLGGRCCLGRPPCPP